MQHPVKQVKEILRVLLGLVEEGKIKKKKDSDKLGPEFRWRIVDEEIKRKKYVEDMKRWEEVKKAFRSSDRRDQGRREQDAQGSRRR